MVKKKIQAKIEERDGGYYFPELDIHLIAKDESSARKLVKKYYGFNPDEQVKSLKSDKNNSADEPNDIE